VPRRSLPQGPWQTPEPAPPTVSYVDPYREPDEFKLLAQRFIFPLQTVVLLVQVALFAAQAPKMERAALADNGDQNQQADQGAEYVQGPTLG